MYKWIHLAANEKQSVVAVTGSTSGVPLDSACPFILYPNYYIPSLSHSYSFLISKGNTRGKGKICETCYGRECNEPLSSWNGKLDFFEVKNVLKTIHLEAFAKFTPNVWFCLCVATSKWRTKAFLPLLVFGGGRVWQIHSCLGKMQWSFIIRQNNCKETQQ